MTTSEIPFLDLAAQYQETRAEIDAAVLQVLASGRYILGPEVQALETAIAEQIGCRHAVATGSGTDALHLALRTAGIGPGDEVITSPFTFVATVEAICYTGARPVFADVDPVTLTLDPHQAETAIGPATRAILPVHLYGCPADLESLKKVAERHRLAIVEDAAQALGATINGRVVGSVGLAGCLSFYPTKNLGAAGDGGMVVTNDAAIAERVRMLRNHGTREAYRHHDLGYNSRLDEIQAAVLRVKLGHLERWNARRRLLARRYATLLTGLPVQIPVDPPGRLSAYNIFTVRTPRRNDLQEALRQARIQTMVYYPQPLHLEAPYRGFGRGPGSLPVAEEAAATVLSLPCSPTLTEAQLERTAEAISVFFR
ncbi:MAG: DegT/DnrJ/EryC1/StrS family aminotransferase [Candidatus Methylomirabilales bacterium]